MRGTTAPQLREAVAELTTAINLAAVEQRRRDIITLMKRRSKLQAELASLASGGQSSTHKPPPPQGASSGGGGGARSGVASGGDALSGADTESSSSASALPATEAAMAVCLPCVDDTFAITVGQRVLMLGYTWPKEEGEVSRQHLNGKVAVVRAVLDGDLFELELEEPTETPTLGDVIADESMEVEALEEEALAEEEARLEAQQLFDEVAAVAAAAAAVEIPIDGGADEGGVGAIVDGVVEGAAAAAAVAARQPAAAVGGGGDDDDGDDVIPIWGDAALEGDDAIDRGYDAADADDADEWDDAGEAEDTEAVLVVHREHLEALRAASAFRYGCRHYRRRCKIVAPCCGVVFPCRFCHDEAQDKAGAASLRAMSQQHVIDRYAVTEVVCALCEHRQPVQAECERCHVRMGRYFCASCKFYDDDTSKGQVRRRARRIGGRR